MKIFCCSEKKHHPLCFFIVVKTSHNLRILLNNKIYSIGKKVSLNCGIFLQLQENIVDENILLHMQKISVTIFFVVLKTSHYLRILLNNKIYSISKKVSLNCEMFFTTTKKHNGWKYFIVQKKHHPLYFFVVVKISHNLRILLNNKIYSISKKISLNSGMFLPLQENIVDENILAPKQKISVTIFSCSCKNIPQFKDTFE